MNRSKKNLWGDLVMIMGAIGLAALIVYAATLPPREEDRPDFRKMAETIAREQEVAVCKTADLSLEPYWKTEDSFFCVDNKNIRHAVHAPDCESVTCETEGLAACERFQPQTKPIWDYAPYCKGCARREWFFCADTRGGLIEMQPPDCHTRKAYSDSCNDLVRQVRAKGSSASSL